MKGTGLVVCAVCGSFVVRSAIICSAFPWSAVIITLKPFALASLTTLSTHWSTFSTAF